MKTTTESPGDRGGEIGSRGPRAAGRRDHGRGTHLAGAGIRAALLFVWMLAVPDAARAASEVARLSALAERAGVVRVLARLDVTTVPEGYLDERGQSEQRGAIASLRNLVAGDLAGTSWRMTREFRTIPYVALELDADALRELADSHFVLDVVEDRLERTMLPESVPLVQADGAWAAGYDGSGWVMAVLDTGVLASHPFLAGKVADEACYSLTGSCPSGGTSQLGPGAGQPCAFAPGACSHGTHVAGIAAGRGTSFSGVARGAGVIAIQVFSRFSGEDCADDVEDPCAKSFTSDTIAALERVFELRDTFRIAAANLSLGGGSFRSPSECDRADSARKAIIDNLRSAGIATIAAAGNEGAPDALSAPACVSSAISVGAVTGLDRVAGFSNSASFLSLLAPGVSILSSFPPDGFARIGGTSQATPFVSGAFAVMSQRLGRADVDGVLAALASTGVPVADPRNGSRKPRIAIQQALDALSVPSEESGLQVTPDGARTLISKDVAGERWAIMLNHDDGTVTGNVFLPAGGEPQFVWCERLSDDGNPDPVAVRITLSCAGAVRCAAEPCASAAWTSLGEVTLPGSFFLP